LSLDFSHLAQWFGNRSLHEIIDRFGRPDQLHQWTYQFPNPFKWEISNYSIQLTTGLNTHRPLNGLEATEYGYITVISDNDKDLGDWLSDIINPLEQLLQIAILAPVELRRVRIVYQDELGNYEMGERDTGASDLVVNKLVDSVGKERLLWDHEILFHPRDLTNEIVAAFLDVNSNQARARRLFLAYDRALATPNDRFLSYVRMLENFHRAINPIHPAEQDAYEVRLKGFLQGHSEADKEFFAGKLNFGYEPSLPDRINSLRAPWRNLLVEIVGTRQFLGEEVTRIVKHRHFLAHQLDETQRQFSGSTLRRVNMFMGALFRLRLLNEVGFSVEQSGEILRGTEIFNSLVHAYRA